MDKNKKLLVFDALQDRRAVTLDILAFMECTAEAVETRDELVEKLTADAGAHALVLGSGDSARSLVDTFHEVRRVDPYIPVLVVRPPAPAGKLHADIEKGAIDIVETPLRHSHLQRALQKIRTYRENRHEEGAPRSVELFRSLVGSSPGIQSVRKMVEQVAGSEANVLILGESGTGKEVVARHIHYHSPRRSKPFVPVNCGAIPPDLLESELFGHEKGAFTGAISARQGRFELAEGGTLFLDEIGDMSLAMQIKLLRVLQERTFERVGSSISQLVDVRIVAATHVDLERAIAAQRFREDLYYRLNVFPIETPPLRERTEDLPLLINDLTERLAHEGYGRIQIQPGVLKCLSGYPWPGNVRELANLIERLAILYPNGTVEIQDLPEKYRPADFEVAQIRETHEETLAPPIPSPRLPRSGIDLKEHLNQLEYNLVLQALNESNWVVAHAAKRLKMGRTTLVEKMRKFRLQRREEVAGL